MPGDLTREWGDGIGDTREHVINYISYEADYIQCRCGAVITNIADGSAWRAHGGAVFVGRGFEERSPAAIPAADAHIAALLDYAHWYMSNCTCGDPTQDIRDCPNYIEGDETPDEEKDDD